MEDRKMVKRAISLMSDGYVCDHCLGRSFAELLSGFSNEERGMTVRNFVAFLVDSGEELKIDHSNFHGTKMHNAKISHSEPGKCKVCKGFFSQTIGKIASDIVEKTKGYEFETFLLGTVLSSELSKAEEKVWESVGIEFVEPIKNEINRELGKLVEGMSGKRFDQKDPDITIIIDLEKNEMNLQVKSVYVYGRYQKLARGIPQTKWVCRECGGKGCKRCGGEGKMYPTSVQEIIEKPMLKAFKAKKTKFHGSGREDVDARCLGKRPFIIEMVRPKIRGGMPKTLQSEVNKSSKVKVYNLRIASKDDIETVKSSRYDKTYVARVKFEKKVDKSKLTLLKKLKGKTISQNTPNRVLHRRSDLKRMRKVKSISAKLMKNGQVEFKITGEAGLYIKELISGDSGRTQPNVSEIIGNSVKNIELDVVKIWDRRGN